MRILWLLVFLAMASASAQSATRDLKSVYTEWPCGENYERIGNPNFGPIFTIYVPSSFVENPPKTLIGKPWGAVHFLTWYPDGATTDSQVHHWDIGMINGHKQGYFVILIQWDKWIRLNEPQALPLINEIMEKSYQTPRGDKPIPVGSMSNEMLDNYLTSVVQLFSDCGGRHHPMSKDSWKASYLSKKQSEDIRPFCVPPVVGNEKGKVKVTANFLMSTGAVLRWTFTLMPGDLLKITKIETKELCPQDSFVDPAIEDL